VRKKTQLTREQTFLRVGAVCAILGAVVSVAAGTGFDNITNELGTQAVLRYISSRPDWYWPTVQLGFILGALLWVGALAALANASIAAPVPEQASLLLAGDTLLWILGGTWAGVLSLFHGVPFVLFGLAVVLDRSYPTWLGWFGFVGGLGSLICGVTTFLGVGLGPERLFIVFALVVSLWMVAMGILMWRRAATATDSRNHQEDCLKGNGCLEASCRNEREIGCFHQVLLNHETLS
jgi:hypothetical protein